MKLTRTARAYRTKREEPNISDKLELESPSSFPAGHVCDRVMCTSYAAHDSVELKRGSEQQTSWEIQFDFYNGVSSRSPGWQFAPQVEIYLLRQEIFASRVNIITAWWNRAAPPEQVQAIELSSAKDWWLSRLRDCARCKSLLKHNHTSSEEGNHTSDAECCGEVMLDCDERVEHIWCHTVFCTDDVNITFPVGDW